MLCAWKVAFLKSGHNYDIVVTLLKEKLGSKESIIETLLQVTASPISSGMFNDINCTHNSDKRLLRQLESQGEMINEQNVG